MSRLAVVAVVAVLAAVSVPVLGLVSAARDRPVAGPPVPAPAPVRVTPAGTGTSPVTWTGRATGDPAVDAVLVAYRGYLGTAVRLAETPDPADPALAVVATGAKLAELRQVLATAVRDGASTRGPVTASASLVTAGPAAVTLLACTDLSGQRTSSATGPAVAGRPAAVTVELRRVDGSWRVGSSSRVSLARCR